MGPSPCRYHLTGCVEHDGRISADKELPAPTLCYDTQWVADSVKNRSRRHSDTVIENRLLDAMLCVAGKYTADDRKRNPCWSQRRRGQGGAEDRGEKGADS